MRHVLCILTMNLWMYREMRLMYDWDLVGGLIDVLDFYLLKLTSGLILRKGLGWI